MPFAQNIDSNLILTTGIIRDLAITNFAAEILATLPNIAHFPLQIYEDFRLRNETYIGRGRVDPDEGFLYLLSDLVEQNLLILVDIESDVEFEDFGEATRNQRLPKQRLGSMVYILAKHRQWIVGCNDRKMMKLLDSLNPQSKYVTTVNLIKNWIQVTQVNQSETEISEVFTRLRSVHVTPDKSHPLHPWWHGKIKLLEGS